MRALVLPSARLLSAVVLCLASAVLCTRLVRQQPWLGLEFERTAAGSTLRLATVDAIDPAQGAVAGDSLMSIGALGGQPVALEAGDLIEEPDLLETWAEENLFYERQTQLSRILHASVVTLTLLDKTNTVRTVTVVPRVRPLRNLPVLFWLQLLFGAAGMIIGAWVWALRPTEWGPRAFAITGVCVLLFAHAAAIYSARELALPGDVFRTLSAVKHFGAIHFGAALCALFLVYPARLTGSGFPLVLGGIAFLWWLACVAHLAPDQDWGWRFPVMLEMLLAILISMIQWRRTRGDPAARAVLRWFAIIALTGCGAFIGYTAVVRSVGGLPPLPQGYAFGFFVLMYAGFAVGLLQYRVFDLDQWAYRLLFWGLIVAAFVALDIALIGTASSGTTKTIAIATLLALGTFPLRRWVWSRLFDTKVLAPEQLFEKALHVAYATSDRERDERWRALLGELFDPLQAAPDRMRNGQDPAPDTVSLIAQGRELAVPAVASSPAMRLTYARGGKRLFTPGDARRAQTLVALMQTADESRKAYDIGVSGEHTRIARDLHDTVSSPLLAGLAPIDDTKPNGAQLAAVQDDIRRAVRSVVSGETAAGAPVADCIADARYAAVERLTVAGLSVTWPINDVGGFMFGPQERHAFTAFMHEAITNVIRHARASHVDVTITVNDGELYCRIADNGRGFTPDPNRAGDGLPNLVMRAITLSGNAAIGPRRDGVHGTEVVLTAPLAARNARR